MFKSFAAALALLLTVSACTDVTTPAQVAFQGEVNGSMGGQSITGSVAAVSRGSSTEAGIEVTLPTVGAKVGWQINEGTCNSPGEIVGGRGAYVDLTAAANGVARLERTFISERLSENGRYHAVVVDATNRTTILACGNLERVQFAAADNRAGNVPGLQG